MEAVFLDFSKAFNIISYNIPTGKLKKWGLSEWEGGGLKTGGVADPRGS